MRQRTLTNKAIAGLVHSFTATGAVTGFLALVAILHDQPAIALLWLGVAMVIDGLDGPMARYFSISEALPHVDGVVLDQVIDFLTYSLIPSIFLYYFGLIPDAIGIVAACIILMTSLYSFANKDLKTRDNFFNGFPATWNFVVLGFYLLDTGVAINFTVVVLCGLLTFFPVKFIHPFRVRRLRPLTIPMTIAWSAVTVYLILERQRISSLIENRTAAISAFLLLSTYFLLLSVIRSVRGKL